MSQVLQTNPNRSLLIALFAALLIVTFFFGRQCKQPEVIVAPLSDEKFKQMENTIKDSQRAILDSIKLRYTQIGVQTQSIYINHQNLKNDLKTIYNYSDNARLLDSVLFAAGYR